MSVPERLDLGGVALVTAGVVALVWALVRANDIGWSSAEIVSALVAGCALLLALVRWEQRAREPMLPLRMSPPGSSPRCGPASSSPHWPR